MPAKKTAKKSAAKSKVKSTPSDDTEIRATFKKLVNMSGAQIEKFLATQDSKRVGFKEGGKGESVGHDSGRKIINIKAKKAAELDAADIKHMHKVVGYIKRHSAQGPDHKADIKESKWRLSLMNWGHDPLKK